MSQLLLNSILIYQNCQLGQSGRHWSHKSSSKLCSCNFRPLHFISVKKVENDHSVNTTPSAETMGSGVELVVTCKTAIVSSSWLKVSSSFAIECQLWGLVCYPERGLSKNQTQLFVLGCIDGWFCCSKKKKKKKCCSDITPNILNMPMML